MNRVIKYLAILAFIILLSACGSKRNPTGGPVDTVNPEIVATLPQEFGSITDQIEITFSKAMDKGSFLEGLYFYPPISAKKLSYSGRTLQIRINEALKPNTNYYVTLSTRIKDTRGNPLSRNHSLVFSSGKLNELRLSGNISYEDAADSSLPLSIDLYSADALLVLSQITQGSSYAIEALNPAEYVLRAYQDKDANGRYDFSNEAWFESRIHLKSTSNLDLKMAYADTSMVEIREIRPVSERELDILFTEIPASIGTVSIRSSNGNRLPVLIKELDGQKLTLITEAQDSLSYKLEIRDLLDRKSNLNKVSGIRFQGSRKADLEAPRLLASIPRNGTSVSSLQPVLELRFSEIIPQKTMRVRLEASDTGNVIPIEVLTGDSRIYRFRPLSPLANYRSHRLIVQADTQDSAGNPLGTEAIINFLPLLKAE